MPDDEYDQRVVDLQDRILVRLDELTPLTPGRADYDDAARAVLDAAAELIAFEGRLPAMRDEPPRRDSLLVVRWAGRLVGAVAVLLGMGVVVGLASWWWLPVLVLLLAAGIRLLLVPVEPPGGRHTEQRLGAYLTGAGAVVWVAPIAGLVTGWWAFAGSALAVMLAVVGVLCVIRPPVTGPHPLTGR